jgi:hypothetical protein
LTPRFRQRQRYRSSYLNRSQIRAAYTLYKRLGTVVAVARLGWDKWGYVSSHQANKALLLAFKREGYFQLNGKPFGARDICCGCGVNVLDRTYGCKVCKDRHTARKRRGMTYRLPNGILIIPESETILT